MSRTSSLWAAGAVALLFALIIGAVVLRPALTADADGVQGDGNPALTTTNGDPASWDDDDDAWDDDDEWDDDEHEDDEDEDEHEDDD